MTPARGALIWGILASVVLGGVYTASLYYPDRPSAPKEYEDGLDMELGGPGSVRASKFLAD
jgi:NADH dehydrogenase (ubiquinone) 1 beta subcomplex subunit 8